MAKQRSNKPTPKSQRQISKDLQEPYDTTRGNPNDADPKSGQPDFNRGNKISWKGDTTKPLTIGLEDIDESIMYYFNEVIKPTVEQNGKNLKVPIVYGSAEKWKQFQKDGYYRDKKGSIMQPLIMFKRDGMVKNLSVGNKLDSNNPSNYGVFQKKYTNRNSYDQFEILNNRIPDVEYVAVVYPDYVTLTYSCTISTYYVSQMNKIIEAINYAANSYWGDPERFKFMATIEDFQDEIIDVAGQDRVAKTNFKLVIKGYIIPDTLQKSLNEINRINKKTTLSLSMEIMESSEFFKSNPEIESSPSTRSRTSSPSSNPSPIVVPYNDINFAIGTEDDDITTNGGLTVYTGHVSRNMTATSVMIGMKEGPTGSSAEFDIKINGTTMFSQLPNIESGETTTLTATNQPILSITNLVVGDKIEAFITNFGVTTPGKGVKVYILGN